MSIFSKFDKSRFHPSLERGCDRPALVAGNDLAALRFSQKGLRDFSYGGQLLSHPLVER